MSGSEENSEASAEPSSDARTEPLEVKVLPDRGWRANFLSYAASVVALAALIVSIWQGYLAYQQNLFSVRPLLVIDADFVDNAKKPGLFIENRGLGPATIVSTRVIADTKDLGAMTLENWRTFRRAYGLQETVRMNVAILDKGFVIATKQKKFLITLKEGEARTLMPEIIDALIHKLKIEICHCSLYDECWLITYKTGLSHNRPAKCRA